MNTLRSCLLGLCLWALAAGAQGEPPAPQPTDSPSELSAEEGEGDPLRADLAALQRLADGQRDLRARSAELRRQLADTELPEERTPLEQELASISERLEASRSAFDKLASDQLLGVAPPPEQEKDIEAQVEAMLLPIVQAFTRWTEESRQREDLREEIEGLEQETERHREAMARLEQLLAGAEDPVQGELSSVRARLEGRQEGLELQLVERRRTLEKLEDASLSFRESLEGALGDWLVARLVSMLAALGALVGVVLLMLLSQGPVLGLLDRPNLRVLRKSVGVAYNALGVLLGYGAALAALYARGDLLLFNIGLLLLVLVAYGSRSVVPSMMEELRLALNLGTVREGERVIWKGVPWLVEHLNFRCRLVNERLQEGHVEVHAREIIPLHSTPNVDGEPWFPTQVGDWVELADGTFGRVAVQTPYSVMLQREGVEPLVLPTAQFLQREPRNLSEGFLMEESVLLPVSAQARLASVKERMASGVRAALADEALEHLEVLALPPRPHGLRLCLRLRWPGEAAPRRRWLQGRVQDAAFATLDQLELSTPVAAAVAEG